MKNLWTSAQQEKLRKALALLNDAEADFEDQCQWVGEIADEQAVAEYRQLDRRVMSSLWTQNPGASETIAKEIDQIVTMGVQRRLVAALQKELLQGAVDYICQEISKYKKDRQD